MGHLETVATDSLKSNTRNARTYSKKHIKQIAGSIQKFGFNNPILVDEQFVVMTGHGRLAAAKQLGLNEVPVVCLSHLSDAEKRAYILADNKIALNAGWDSELLATELGELGDLLPDLEIALEITGFETGEIDIILTDYEEPSSSVRKEDEVPVALGAVYAKLGDIWQLGGHRLCCGDARDASAVRILFGEDVANLVITDPPYNVKVQGHVGGRGKTKHDEFAFASGEMSEEEFGTFLLKSIKVMRDQSDGVPAKVWYLHGTDIPAQREAARSLKLPIPYRIIRG